MFYLLGLALFIIILGFLPDRTGLNNHNHKYYLIICGTVVALVAGLRTYHTGSPDTYSYVVNSFEKLRYFDDFRSYYDIYLDEHGFLLSEAGFYGALWLLGRITGNGHWLVFITSAFFTFSACRFIYKNSLDVPLSLMIYVCLGLFSFNMDCMRQATAMSICLFAYEHVKNRNLIRFLILVLLAMMFHRSALCFLPIYLVPTLKNSWGNSLIFLVCVIAIVASFDKLIPLFNEATGKEYAHDSGMDSGGVSVILIYFFAIALTLITGTIHNPNIRMPFFCTITSVCMYLSRYFTSRIVERSSFYYFYFVILLIPTVIQELSPEERKLIRMLFIIGSIMLYAYRIYVGTFNNFSFFFFD